MAEQHWKGGDSKLVNKYRYNRHWVLFKFGSGLKKEWSKLDP